MVFYALIFAALGATIAFVTAKVCNVDFRGSYGLSNGGLLVFFAGAAGFCVGLGIGATKIANGTYMQFKP